MALYADEQPYIEEIEPEGALIQAQLDALPETAPVKPRRTRTKKTEEKTQAVPASLWTLKLKFDANDSDRKSGVFEVLKGAGEIETAAMESLRSSLILVFEGQGKKFKLVAEE